MAEKLVLVDIPVLSVTAGNIGICIDQCNALKRVAANDGRRIQRIADKLSIVELDDRAADLVLSWWEVDDGSLRKGVATLFATAVTILNGGVDLFSSIFTARVICFVVINDIPKDLVV